MGIVSMIDTQNTRMKNIASEIEARSAFENRYGVVGSLLASGNYSSGASGEMEAFRDGWMQSEVETKKSIYQMQTPAISDDQLEVGKMTCSCSMTFGIRNGGDWKSSADMVAQGEANAYEHARGLLETAIKQDEATCQWLRNQLATIQTELDAFITYVNEHLVYHESDGPDLMSKIQKLKHLIKVKP